MSALLRLPVRHAVTLLVLAGLLAACTGSGATTPAPTALPPGVAPMATSAPTSPATPPLTPVPTPATAPTTAAAPDLTPNDLLLAALSSGDVKAVAPTQTWWPYLPEFNVGFSPYTDNSADPSVRFFVVQDYELIGGSSKRQIQSALVLFADVASATQGLARLNQTTERDSTRASGPAVGDASSYFTRSNIGLGTPTIRRSTIPTRPSCASASGPSLGGLPSAAPNSRSARSWPPTPRRWSTGSARCSGATSRLVNCRPRSRSACHCRRMRWGPSSER